MALINKNLNNKKNTYRKSSINLFKNKKEKFCNKNECKQIKFKLQLNKKFNNKKVKTSSFNVQEEEEIITINFTCRAKRSTKQSC